MTVWNAIVLGLVQGITEFLPVSSSGHLVIVQQLFGMKEPALFFDVCLHLGTLAAVCAFLWRDLKDLFGALRRLRPPAGVSGFRHFRDDPDLRLLFLMATATVVTGIVGVTFQHRIERLFGSLPGVGTALIATGILLSLTPLARATRRTWRDVGVGRAALIGLGQGVAVVPGLSRSGTTIALALFLGLPRERAARFSFLLFIPAILGATVLQFDATKLQGEAASILLGTAAAALSGFLALRLLFRMVRNGRLWYFAPYCVGLGTLVLLWRP